MRGGFRNGNGGQYLNQRNSGYQGSATGTGSGANNDRFNSGGVISNRNVTIGKNANSNKFSG